MSPATAPSAAIPARLLRSGSLCTGYGGLDLAVLAVLGGHLAWVADHDRHAAAILAARFPHAQNLGDITVTDWAAVPQVDVLTAGFPCQDISQAGKRAGIEGTRSGIWTNVAQAVRVLHPRLLVVENVAALRNRGLDRVLGDLAEAGYDAIWRCVRASDVGAPHRRERLFLLGWPADEQPGVADRLRGLGRRGDGNRPAAAHPDGGERASRDRPRGPQGGTAPGRPAGCDLAPAGHPGRPVPGGPAAGGAAPCRGVPPFKGIPGTAATEGTGEYLSSGGRRHAGTGAAADADRAADLAEPRGPHGMAAAQWQDAAVRLASRGHLAAHTAGLRRGAWLAQSAQLQRQLDVALGHRSSAPAGVPPQGTGAARHQATDGARAERAQAAPHDHEEPGLAVDWGPYESAIRGWELILGLPAPVPTEPARRGGRRLRAAFVEWIMGLVPGFVTSLDQVPRAAQLRALGNGVVPQQAVYAITLLLADLADVPREADGPAGPAEGVAA